MTTKYEVYEDLSGEYRWRAKAAEDGHLIAVSSCSYPRKEDAGACLVRVLLSLKNGCTIEYVDLPLNVEALAEGVHEDEDGAA